MTMKSNLTVRLFPVDILAHGVTGFLCWRTHQDRSAAYGTWQNRVSWALALEIGLSIALCSAALWDR